MKLIEAGAENWRDRTDADMLSLSMMRERERELQRRQQQNTRRHQGGNQEMGRRSAKQTGERERERDKTFGLLFNLDRVRGWSIASSLFHSFSLSFGE